MRERCRSQLTCHYAAGRLPENATKQIIKSMAAMADNHFVQIAACHVFKIATEQADEADLVRISACTHYVPLIDRDSLQLYKKDVVQPVLLAMRSHPGSVDLLKEACGLLWALSVNEDCGAIIGTHVLLLSELE